MAKKTKTAKAFATAAAKTEANGLFAEEHPAWQRQTALQAELAKAAKPTRNPARGQ